MKQPKRIIICQPTKPKYCNRCGKQFIGHTGNHRCPSCTNRIHEFTDGLHRGKVSGRIGE